MDVNIARKQTPDLLREYNREPFRVLHALTIEDTMQWYAKELDYGDDEDLQGIAGLFHDTDFELYPKEYYAKVPELLRPAGTGDKPIHAVRCHGCDICSDVELVYEIEKVLFASDELTDLIGAAAGVRPSKNVMDMGVSSLKKKFKDKRFAAGCSRGVVVDRAEKLGWILEELMGKTTPTTRPCKGWIRGEMDNL